jgi:ABC-type transport system involved in multi-copper enzyme maturation permease subunit
MPIYDQSYRRYEARGPLRRVRFWPITREALRLILVRRAFLALLAAGWLPFIGFVIFFYAVTRFPEAGNVVPVNASLFGRFFLFQWPLALLLTTFAGAGLVSNDLRTGAILVYLSRPLSRRDYVIGKLGVLVALNLSVTLAPALLLYLVGIALAPSHLLKWELATIAPAIVVYSLALTLVLSLAALAVSALSRSARVAGIAFFGLLVGLEIVRVVLVEVLDKQAVALISLQANLRALMAALFGLKEFALSVHWGFAALTLAVVGVVCLAILRSRVRAVEIVR